MEIIVSSISDKGKLADERIGLKVLRDCDLKYFQLFKTNFTDKGFYNQADASYWFTPQTVKAGDKVVVYTKSGINSIKENSDGTTTYFLYWGLSNPIFTSSDNGVVLAQMKDWELSKGK
jgi:hypothetical protein